MIVTPSPPALANFLPSGEKVTQLIPYGGGRCGFQHDIEGPDNAGAVYHGQIDSMQLRQHPSEFSHGDVGE
jgi:hypothetical protein